jgi:hypothetical protein
MTAKRVEWKGCAASLAAALFAVWPQSAAAADFGQALKARLWLAPIVLDYELPGHPNQIGRGHAGMIAAGSLIWSYDDFVEIEAGVLGRVPFALDFDEELGAFPLLAVTVAPFGRWLTLRLGSIDPDHGHHPALLDEDRYAYGRPYEELYNRSIEVTREVGDDPFLPVENGFSLRAVTEYVRAEVYLDWQLLETEAHREKFAVGVLSRFESKWIDAGFDYRLVHYGGQLFTRVREGPDPKRVPSGLAVFLQPRLSIDWFEGELYGAFVYGRAPEAHHGFEVGGDVTLFSIGRLGYRLWLPRGGVARFVSEDGDPVYSGPRSHRAIIGIFGRYGAAELAGRLDLVFAEGADKVQYLTVTTLAFTWEPLIFADFSYP